MFLERGFVIKTPEKTYTELSNGMSLETDVSNVRLEQGEVFDTGWQVVHDPERLGERDRQYDEFTHYGLRTKFDKDGNLQSVTVKRSSAKEYRLDVRSLDNLILQHFWVFGPEGVRTQTYQARELTDEQRRTLRIGAPHILMETLEYIRHIRTENANNLAEGLLFTYPSREREGAEILRARAADLAVAEYHYQNEILNEGRGDPEDLISARQLAIGLLYDDGVGMPRANIEKMLGLSAGTVWEDIKAYRDELHRKDRATETVVDDYTPERSDETVMYDSGVDFDLDNGEIYEPYDLDTGNPDYGLER